jgi:hypothetical protein
MLWYVYDAEWKRGKQDSLWRFCVFEGRHQTHGPVGEWLAGTSRDPDDLREAISRSPGDGALVLRLIQLEAENAAGGASVEEWRAAVGLEINTRDPGELAATSGQLLVLPSAVGQTLDGLALSLRRILVVDKPARLLVAWHSAEPWMGENAELQKDWQMLDLAVDTHLSIRDWSTEIEAWTYAEQVAEAAGKTAEHLGELLNRWELASGEIFSAHFDVQREHERLAGIGSFVSEVKRRSGLLTVPSRQPGWTYDIVALDLPGVMRNATVLFAQMLDGMDAVRMRVSDSFRLLAAVVTSRQLVLAEREDVRRDRENARRDRLETTATIVASLFLGPSLAAALLQVIAEDRWWVIVSSCIGAALLLGVPLLLVQRRGRLDRD